MHEKGYRSVQIRRSALAALESAAIRHADVTSQHHLVSMAGTAKRRLEPVIMVRSGRQKAILSPTPQRFGMPGA